MVLIAIENRTWMWHPTHCQSDGARRLDFLPRVEQDGHCVFVDRLACVDPIRPSSKRDQQCRADLKPRQHQQVALDSTDPRQTGGSQEGVQESAHR
ncbi:unnamed protein product [Vitrella brassicaformis CCMP3155]|uniref:Uncharacterized protein n=1 Tax=Vitrella brassicaformis (strain CCMP3155) TaxID=1169540 RepID=A0A0G4GGN6_VITBC|nr:unnamed protein product [Vitrella brassicaformis CCMP3155]|eukprot:CEM28787.1 unnamed protein product [Vitrella brassicaformis CCMP3155]